MSIVRLKAGRERALERRHPWIFAGSVERVEGQSEPGATVEIVSATGTALARAALSPSSQIRARVWTWNAEEPVDAAFFHARIGAALARRGGYPIIPGARDAGRMLNAEADGLPGVIADRYADCAVLQFLSAGAERWRAEITAALLQLSGCSVAFERSDAEVRALEGLVPRTGVLVGEPPPESIEIETAGGVTFAVDVRNGHKTGMYLDQLENHRRVAALAPDAEVLDCFCYNGAFSVHALAARATRVCAVDSSGAALEIAARNLRLNRCDPARIEWVEADVFAYLRQLRDRGRKFDLIILDPPKFAPTAAHVERAARAYKDINLLALKLLRPGGRLATFSCSGGVSAELFQRIVAGAAADARVETQILGRLGAPADHAVLLAFPEGEYLKGLVMQTR